MHSHPAAQRCGLVSRLGPQAGADDCPVDCQSVCHRATTPYASTGSFGLQHRPFHAIAMAATSDRDRVWFRFEGRPTSVCISAGALVDDLRKAIKAELVDTLRGVDAFRLLLSAAYPGARWRRGAVPRPRCRYRSAAGGRGRGPRCCRRRRT
jgi:hypothetical protein